MAHPVKGARVLTRAEAGGNLPALGYRPPGTFTGPEAALYDNLIAAGATANAAYALVRGPYAAKLANYSLGKLAAILRDSEGGASIGAVIGAGVASAVGAPAVGAIVGGAIGGLVGGTVGFFTGGGSPPRNQGGRSAPPLPASERIPTSFDVGAGDVAALGTASRFAASQFAPSGSAVYRNPGNRPNYFSSQGQQVRELTVSPGGAPGPQLPLESRPIPRAPELQPADSGAPLPLSSQPGATPVLLPPPPQPGGGILPPPTPDYVPQPGEIPPGGALVPQHGLSPNGVPILDQQTPCETCDRISNLERQVGQEIETEQRQLREQQQRSQPQPRPLELQPQQQPDLTPQLDRIQDQLNLLRQLENQPADQRDITSELGQKQQLLNQLRTLEPIARQPQIQPQPQQQQPQPQHQPQLGHEPHPQQIQFCVACQSQEDAILFLNGEPAACSVIPGSTQPLQGGELIPATE